MSEPEYLRCNKTHKNDPFDTCIKLPNHPGKCAFIDVFGNLIIDWCSEDEQRLKAFKRALRPPKVNRSDIVRGPWET